MKWFTFLLVLILLPLNAFSECVEYRIIDLGDHMEAICIGEPETALKKKSSNYINKNVQNYQSDISPVAAVTQSTVITSCKLLRADHYDAGNNPNVEVEVSCEVTGKISEYLEFVLHGIGRGNEHLLTTVISGYVGADGSIKKTFIADYGKFINSHKWEPDRSSGAILISQNYVFNEKDARARISQLKQEVADSISQSSSTSGNRDYISMKKGVKFRHGLHQRSFDCATCHQGSSGGSISGFGKEWAHKTCKGCHSDKKGPTSCKGCHK